MEPRLDFYAVPAAGLALKRFMTVGASFKESSLPAVTRELVALRVSQINGCAPCVDIHTKELAAAGETPARLNLVAVWREATVFGAAERAALELAEQGTRVADAASGVDDEVWAAAAAQYDEEQLSTLVLLVSFMNAVNRVNVITRRPAGADVPGTVR
ncbi:carboxymuconolactone decarboxylase family protein [Streptomyces sp. NBC_01498]|uniref:carboxymuconolactone decarboxylase family protein n=1 Tax=Streptomyces sp. NBC_01498 TaxID=2975870 RepID=UPI002E7AEFD4|nr:carboxymuconolactone decarboxylase family protein [Streptomyces sp. NBC_01498]WTL23224.1 carboxymuconolactone decarboxylase family protein [Streptomyces sp. NBC_01498]